MQETESFGVIINGDREKSSLKHGIAEIYVVKQFETNVLICLQKVAIVSEDLLITGRVDSKLLAQLQRKLVCQYSA